MVMPRRAIFILGAFLAATFARAQDCAGPMPDRCSLFNQAKAIFVGELIEENKESFTRKFRVIEAFKGVKSDFIDVAEYRGPLRYKLAGAYLVFANACPWENPDTDCLTSWACSNTRELKYACRTCRAIARGKDWEASRLSLRNSHAHRSGTGR